MVWLATMLLVTLPDVHSWTTTTTILPQPQQQQLLQTSTSYDRRRISLIALRASSTAPPPTTLDGMEIPNPIECVGDVIVVKVRDTLTATGGGILLPDQSQERPTEGLVLATGPGRIHPRTAVRIPNPIAEGMSVV